MNDAMFMKMSQTLERLSADGRNLSFRDDVMGDDVRQAAAFHVLHHDPEIASKQERIDEIDCAGPEPFNLIRRSDERTDIFMPRLLHDDDLVDDEILLRLLLDCAS